MFVRKRVKFEYYHVLVFIPSTSRVCRHRAEELSQKRTTWWWFCANSTLTHSCTINSGSWPAETLFFFCSVNLCRMRSRLNKAIKIIFCINFARYIQNWFFFSRFHSSLSGWDRWRDLIIRARQWWWFEEENFNFKIFHSERIFMLSRTTGFIICRCCCCGLMRSSVARSNWTSITHFLWSRDGETKALKIYVMFSREREFQHFPVSAKHTKHRLVTESLCRFLLPTRRIAW